MDKRRIPILFVIGIFMLVTTAHVTVYSAKFEPNWYLAPLSLLYALGVEASIVISVYFTEWQTTRKWGWAGFFVFTLASGIMNWGFIEPETIPAMVYALFPTGSIALLGFLYRQVDVLSKFSRKSTGKVPAKEPEMPEEKAEDIKKVPAKELALPEGLRRVPENIEDFRQMVMNGEADPDKLTGDDLASVKGYSARTGRLWLADVRNGKPL